MPYDHETIKFMRDMENKINEILIKIEGLPKKILDESDERYAKKDVEKSMEDIRTDITGIKKTRYNTLKEYFKMVINLLISLGLAYLTLILVR